MDELSDVVIKEDDKETNRPNYSSQYPSSKDDDEKNNGIQVTACINGQVVTFEEFDKVFFKPVTDEESGNWSYLFRNEDEEKAKETTSDVEEINENDTTFFDITFSGATPGERSKENFSFTFNMDEDKGPFLLPKPKQQKNPAMLIRPALFTSTPTRKTSSASNSAAAGDNTDFLSSSIQQMHRELRRKNKVCCLIFLLMRLLKKRSKT